MEEDNLYNQKFEFGKRYCQKQCEFQLSISHF